MRNGAASRLLSLILLLLTAAAASAQPEGLPAFPGAEGFGRYASGGRGGRVYHVTSLGDDGAAGTLRWACSQPGPRTIVFDVSGTIFLTSPLRLRGDDVTIAGQTAPGDGICVADYPFTIEASNVIVRYVRFRLGNRHADRHEGDGLGGMDQRDIIVDHCSVSWSVDECLSVYGNRNSTVQWCIVSHSLHRSGHSKGAHGYGGNWGGSGASYHHNLLIHHTSRTPRLGPRPGTQADERMDLRNNVIYNWSGNGCYGGEGMKVNIVNNYYKPGPATAGGRIGRRIASIGCRTTAYTHHGTARPNVWDALWHVWGKFYVDGNVNPVYDDVTRDNWTYGIYEQTEEGGFDGTYDQATRDSMRTGSPIAFVRTTTHDAATAYERVLDYAGASLHRDGYDAALADDARQGTARWGRDGIVDSQDEAGGWPVLAMPAGGAGADTDGDGMPDAWEARHGLDAHDAADGARQAPDGYTWLEYYMNGLVAHITEAQNAGGVLLGDVVR